QGLAAPPEAPAPPGFTGRVMAHVRAGAEEAGTTLSWSLAPTWVRAVAALALVAGLALGAGLGRTPVPASSPSSLSMVAGPPEGLGASFWTLVEDATAPAPAIPGAAAEAPR
ncbi:MAG TPA: hypothetical protein VOA87_08225, partial [Thermoanaerobaculia bacterium]|nr:hypothetical protein [Thermoanaerobaculia bacterium]